MASLEKRNGIYGLRWYDGGRRVRESLRTESRTEAEKIQRALEFARDINKHNPFKQPWYQNDFLREIVLTRDFERLFSIKEKDQVPLLKAAEKYIAFKINTPGEWDSPSTQTNYPYAIRHFVKHVGNIPIDEVSSEHIVSFVKRKELSEFTVQSEIRRIKAFLHHFGVKVKVSGPNPQKDIPGFLYNDELKKVCLYHINKEREKVQNKHHSEANSSWWYPLFWILSARTGMRPSELIKVKCSHIENYEINVRADTRGKSQSAKRRIPLLAQEARQAVDVLTSETIRSLDRDIGQGSYLFGRHSDASKSRVSRAFTRAVKEVLPEKKGFRLRDLRNVFAYWFITRPTDDSRDFITYKLKRMLGHKSSRMSEYYMDTLPFDPDIERLHRW